MTKKKAKKSIKWPMGWLLLTLGVLILVVLLAQIPIERIRYSGGCRSIDNRLSLFLDGQKKVQQARENVEKMNLDREERLKDNPLLEGGCSQGLSYAVYIL